MAYAVLPTVTEKIRESNVLTKEVARVLISRNIFWFEWSPLFNVVEFFCYPDFLREITFGKFKVPKRVILTNLEVMKFDFERFLYFFEPEIFINPVISQDWFHVKSEWKKTFWISKRFYQVGNTVYFLPSIMDDVIIFTDVKDDDFT